MTNMLRAAMEHLSDQRHDHMSESVEFVRPSVGRVTLSAMVAVSRQEAGEFGLALVDAKKVDFVLRVADLVLSSSSVVPQLGDYFEFSPDGVTTYKYTVARDDLDSYFRYTSEYRVDMRVHTDRGGVV